MKKRLLILITILLSALLVACSESENDVEEVPEISDLALEHAYSIINDYDMVKDSHIEVLEEEKKIILAIEVNAATNEEHAKELGDNFARALASGASIYSEVELKSPENEYLGELYDFYDLQIGVGTGADNFIAQGAKVKSASKITW